MSQSVFAKLLNVSVSTVQKWEAPAADKHPSGAAAKLLQIIEQKGVPAIAGESAAIALASLAIRALENAGRLVTANSSMDPQAQSTSANIWVTDFGAGKLFKLGAGGTITQTVSVGVGPVEPGFDGANIWVPNQTGNSITVVQASTGNVVATISADVSNKLNGPTTASFDGERILVTNYTGDTVTVFKAADLSFIGNVSAGAGSAPVGSCSDGINFWVPLHSAGTMLRF
jgi:hypothetical protein